MKPDPIYAAIEAHRIVKNAHAANVEIYNGLERRLGVAPDLKKPPHPDVEKWEAEWEIIDAQLGRAMRKLCRTRPTTLEGISAVTAYLLEAWNIRLSPDLEVEAPDRDNSLELLLRSLGEAAASIAKRNLPRAVAPFKKAA